MNALNEHLDKLSCQRFCCWFIEYKSRITEHIVTKISSKPDEFAQKINYWTILCLWTPIFFITSGRIFSVLFQSKKRKPKKEDWLVLKTSQNVCIYCIYCILMIFFVNFDLLLNEELWHLYKNVTASCSWKWAHIKYKWIVIASKDLLMRNEKDCHF